MQNRSNANARKKIKQHCWGEELKCTRGPESGEPGPDGEEVTGTGGEEEVLGIGRKRRSGRRRKKRKKKGGGRRRGERMRN